MNELNLCLFDRLSTNKYPILKDKYEIFILMTYLRSQKINPIVLKEVIKNNQGMTS